jgi:hypothetical protein
MQKRLISEYMESRRSDFQSNQLVTSESADLIEAYYKTILD